MNVDFYDGVTEDTNERYQKMFAYIQLAEKQGDAIYQEKPWELTVRIRLKKKAAKDEPKN